MNYDSSKELSFDPFLSCALCSKVHDSTNAELEGLKVGDVITMIDDEFICGVSLKEGLEMLSGPMDTTVSLMVNRVQGRTKTRLPFEIVRDFDLKPMDSEKEARKKDRKAAALAERSSVYRSVESSCRMCRPTDFLLR